MLSKKVRVAVLDLYDSAPNQGMRCINEMVHAFAEFHQLDLTYHVFDVRARCEVSDLSYDAYISTGGPGSPLESEGSPWETAYFSLIDEIRHYNKENPEQPKYLFLICHSFQIYVRYYGYGFVNKRKSTSFGVMPIHMTKDGSSEPFFHGLQDPFWAVDSRDWQVTKPNSERILADGGKILCIEKFRPHIDLERAVMAIRFDNAIFGTQFHPEADALGMATYLRTDEKKAHVIKHHGEDKYYDMLNHLEDPDKIMLTHNTIIPAFLTQALLARKTILSL